MKKVVIILGLLMTSTVFASNNGTDCKVTIQDYSKNKVIEMSGACAKSLYLKLEKSNSSFESSLGWDSLTEKNMSCTRDHKNFAAVKDVSDISEEDYTCFVDQK